MIKLATRLQKKYAMEYWGGPKGYFKQRSNELLELLSGNMLQVNKLPLLEHALITAYEQGLKDGHQGVSPETDEGEEIYVDPMDVK